MRRRKARKKIKINRYSVIAVIALAVFAGIIMRLVYLQILHGDEFKERAANKSYTEIPDPAPRGNILDKNGVVLAKNNQSYVLVYNETSDTKKSFFTTMDNVFALLQKNGKVQEDTFELKVPDAKNPTYRFEFRTTDPDTKKNLEVRFKRDRGLNEAIEGKLFGKKKDKYTKEETQKVNNELLKITPEETFKLLVTQYGIDDNKKPKYSPQQERKYILIKDAVKMNSFTGYKPVVIASNIGKETAFTFLQKLNDLPGIDVTTQPTRYYPYGELGSSFLGYISKITYNADKYAEKGYDVSSDYVGVAGLESVYEDRLKGSKGGRIVKLNNYGRVVEELGRREPYPGQNLQLTVDKDVQYAAEKALDEVMSELRSAGHVSDEYTGNATRGAAVVVDVNTGGIIALASRPGYDPNIFAAAGGLSSDLYNQYFNPDLKKFGENYVVSNGIQANYPGKSVDEIVDMLFPVDKSVTSTVLRGDPKDIYPKPFYNYATSGLIPPGSTFKPLTAVAGLEEGVISPTTQILDQGVYTKNNYNGANLEWTQSHYTFGYMDIKKAIEASINYFFFEIGDRLLYQHGSILKGYDTLAKYAWKFGLGVDPTSKQKITTGIEIPENFGQVANLNSIKVSFSKQYFINAVATLKSSMGIDIGVSNGDSDDVKKTKTDLKNLIIQQMQSNKDNNTFSKKLVELLKQLIDEVPELKNKNLSKSDINAAAQQINRAVYDANGGIYTPANIYNASIGQGTDQFTPLQMANYIATLVNGGNRYKLHLVDKITDADGNVVSQVKPEVMEKVSLKQSTIETVKEGMLAVTSGAEGTASSTFQNLPIQTAGKTGSATSNVNQNMYGRSSYANYLGFAPYDNPKIAVFVTIYDGGYGAMAAPVARAIYEAYFKDEIKKLNPNYTPYFDFLKPYFQETTAPAAKTTTTTTTQTTTTH
jgi:penicillin-binding protein 2